MKTPGMRIWGLAALVSLGVMLLGACTTSSGQPATEVCDEQVNPQITIDVLTVKPVEDRHLDIAALSARDSLDKTVPELQGYQDTLGSTSAELHAQLDGDMRADPRGMHWCARLLRATVKIKWDTTVYLARELIPGSCADKAVRQHEAKHVALDRDLLPTLKSDVETSILRVTQRPVWGAGSSWALQDLKAQVQKAAEAAIDTFQTQRNRRQLEIDTPEEYNRVAASCGQNAFPTINGKAATGM